MLLVEPDAQPFPQLHHDAVFSFAKRQAMVRAGLMRILGSPMARSIFPVSSSHGPSATINSSIIGKIERMDATEGYPNSCPLRIKVNPLTFMDLILLNHSVPAAG